MKKDTGVVGLKCFIFYSKSGFVDTGFRIQEEGCQSISYYHKTDCLQIGSKQIHNFKGTPPCTFKRSGVSLGLGTIEQEGVVFFSFTILFRLF